VGLEPAQFADIASLWEDLVPRFHFEIIDGIKLEDPVGLDCKNEEQARQFAEDMARQIVLDLGEDAARKVIVVNEEGAEIYTVPIKR
jgi:hypothetical protein